MGFCLGHSITSFTSVFLSLLLVYQMRGLGLPQWLNDVSLGTSVTLERTRKRNRKKVLTGVQCLDGSRGPGSPGETGVKGLPCPGRQTIRSSLSLTFFKHSQKQGLPLPWPSLSGLGASLNSACFPVVQCRLGCAEVPAICRHRLQQHCGWDVKALLNSG